MQDSKGFYQALGLSPGASVDAIKKAFKKKQVELHPSGPTRRKLKDSAEYKAMTPEQQAAREAELDEQVTKVNEAFKVLGDEERKKNYDAGAGEFSEFEGFEGFSGFGGFGDIFSHFTGGGRKQKSELKVKDTVTELNITYKDVFLGKTSKYRVKVMKVCNTCSGKGGKDSSKCGKCKGSGTVYARISLGLMSTTQQMACPDCEGNGTIIRGPKCTDCKGVKVVQDSKIIEVVIQPGIQDGESIIYTGKGNEYPGHSPGDLVFNISIVEDANCSRIGNHLICKANVDILTALSGGVLYFEHLDGRKLAVKITPFKDFDSAIVIPNEGFKGPDGRKGDVYIKPHILINSGIERSKLSEYIKPLISKPFGEYTNINSTFGGIPEVKQQQQRGRGRERGREVDPSDFFSFF